jgi:hypothetical protein
MAQELEAVAHSDSSVALPVPRVAWPFSVSWRALAGSTGLAVLFLAVAAVVVFAANAPGPLVWSSAAAFPRWVAGPLHGLLGRVPQTTWQVLSGYSALLAVMLGAYGLALAGARAVSMGVVTFAPFTVMWMGGHGLNPLNGSQVGRAALATVRRYER